MDSVKQNIADNLTELRRAHGLTQSELAEKLHYSDKAVSKWERAEALPDVEVLAEIAKLYGVTLDYLVSDPKGTPTPVDGIPPRNKAIIASLAVLLVWCIAVFLFVCLKTALRINYWMAFVWACPVSAIVAIVFNGIWGKRPITFLLVTFLMWSILAALYLQLFSLPHPLNYWYVFLLGAPGQVVIIVWSRLITPKSIPENAKKRRAAKKNDTPQD